MNQHGHGKPASATYRSWLSMWTRCTNTRRKDYKYYGGRGIKVCTRWKSFPLFLKDMGIRPNKKSLDRVNNNKNYTPDNCKWSDHMSQCNNRSRQRIVNGKTIAQLARQDGVPYSTAYYRYVR